jgi:predicted nucleic acid-binding protein
VVVVDTSVWVDVLRDTRGTPRAALARAIGDDELVLTRFIQLELLQGCRDEREWGLLTEYLDTQDYIDLSGTGWLDAARVYFDLRRRGRSVRSPIDCCIAQAAIQHGALLLHRDRDFETIAGVRPLRQLWLGWA